MIGVLFLQSQTYFSADSFLHAEIMRRLDRSRFRVHVALNRSDDSRREMSPRRQLEVIPQLNVRPTGFGASKPVLRPSPVGRWVRSMARDFVSLIALPGYIYSHHIKVIHASEKPRDAFLAVVLAKITRARSCIHLHVGWGEWMSPLTKWALRNADAVIAISPFVADSAVQRGGCRPAAVFTVLNGIDPDRWNPDIDGTQVRAEIGIPAGMPVVGVVSRLFYWKGHIDLVTAFASVKKRVPDAKLVIVGEDDPRGAPGRPPFSVELHELVERLGISGDVVFTGFRTDIDRLMASFDVYAMPSFEEPFGLVYLEAMAMRRPVIGLRSGGVPSIIDDGVTGFLVDVGDVDMLTDRLTRLLESPEQRREMGERARTAVFDRFTTRRMTTDVEHVYELLSRAHR